MRNTDSDDLVESARDAIGVLADRIEELETDFKNEQKRADELSDKLDTLNELLDEADLDRDNLAESLSTKKTEWHNCAIDEVFEDLDPLTDIAYELEAIFFNDPVVGQKLKDLLKTLSEMKASDYVMEE